MNFQVDDLVFWRGRVGKVTRLSEFRGDTVVHTDFMPSGILAGAVRLAKEGEQNTKIQLGGGASARHLMRDYRVDTHGNYPYGQGRIR